MRCDTSSGHLSTLAAALVIVLIFSAELGPRVGKTASASSCTTETPGMETGEKQTNTEYFNKWMDTEYLIYSRCFSTS